MKPHHFLLSLTCAAICQAACADEAAITAKVLKHTSTNGQVCCAVILKAANLPKQDRREHFILIDTSASQVGEHRQQALAVLTSLLKSLPDGDRVRLFAVDLRAEPLDQGLNEAHSPAVADSIETLKFRVPLGATNMEGVLRAAIGATTDQPADIVYIGDGMSTADLIELPELRALTSELRKRQIPVHSFGVGPQKNMHLLGVLALQTGGLVAVDSQRMIADDKAAKSAKTKSGKLADDIKRINRSAEERATEQGKSLAAAIAGPIYFPKELQTSPEEIALLPDETLPLRMDRETIYLLGGELPDDARLIFTGSDGKTIECKLPAATEQLGATFVPVMTGQLETTRGLTNPLAGMILFNIAQTDFSDNITAMAQRGIELLQLGDIEQATKITNTVNESEPNNETAKILKKTIEHLKANPPAPPAATTPKKGVIDVKPITPPKKPK